MSPSNSNQDRNSIAIVSPANPRTPSKKITLKLKVNNQDLEDGKYRQTTPVRSTPRTRKTRKSTTKRQPSKRKPRKPRLTQQDEATDLTVKTQNESHQQLYPSLEDFRSVSEFSFPVLISKPPVRGTDEESQNQTQNETQISQHSIRCAGCGTPAPRDLNMTVEQQRTPQPSTPDTHITPTFESLHLGSEQCIHHDTHFSTDMIVMRRGMWPNTLEFWYDETIAEQAKASQNIDFKMLCLNSINARSKSDIPRTFRVAWDTILESAAATGKAWRKIRRWKQGERDIISALAVREEAALRMDQGQFVEETGRGAWVLRRPGIDGLVRRVLTLGYRRASGRDTSDERSISSIMDGGHHGDHSTVVVGNSGDAMELCT